MTTLMDAAEREESASDALTYEFTYQALGSLAHFDRVLYDGKEFGQLAVPGTPEEEEFLGLPGSARARARARAAACSGRPGRAGTGSARESREAQRARTPAPLPGRFTARSKSSASC